MQTGITYSDLDLEDSFYNEIMIDYNLLKMDMEWTMKNGDRIKLIDMKDSHIKNCINMLKKLEINYSRRAWIDIFCDVLLKRRFEKIEKIKIKICHQ